MALPTLLHCSPSVTRDLSASLGRSPPSRAALDVPGGHTDPVDEARGEQGQQEAGEDCGETGDTQCCRAAPSDWGGGHGCSSIISPRPRKSSRGAATVPGQGWRTPSSLDTNVFPLPSWAPTPLTLREYLGLEALPKDEVLQVVEGLIVGLRDRTGSCCSPKPALISHPLCSSPTPAL